MSAVRHHPIITFFGLTYALTLAAFPFGVFLTFAPLVAVLIVVPLAQGWAGLRELGARMIRWRVRWYWYVVALGLPLAVAVVAIVLNVALGASAPSLATFPPLSSVLVVFALRLINPLDGPLGEEPGWRGFALPGLQAGRSPLLATAILGVLVAVWHVPLVLMGQLPALLGLVGTFAVAFWYTWLFNHTDGSAFMTLVMHASEGTVAQVAVIGLFAEADAARGISLYFGGICVVAIGLVIFDWQFWRAPVPATSMATVQAAYEGESRVR